MIFSSLTSRCPTKPILRRGPYYFACGTMLTGKSTGTATTARISRSTSSRKQRRCLRSLPCQLWVRGRYLAADIIRHHQPEADHPLHLSTMILHPASSLHHSSDLETTQPQNQTSLLHRLRSGDKTTLRNNSVVAMTLARHFQQPCHKHRRSWAIKAVSSRSTSTIARRHYLGNGPRSHLQEPAPWLAPVLAHQPHPV